MYLTFVHIQCHINCRNISRSIVQPGGRIQSEERQQLSDSESSSSETESEPYFEDQLTTKTVEFNNTENWAKKSSSPKREKESPPTKRAKKSKTYNFKVLSD